MTSMKRALQLGYIAFLAVVVQSTELVRPAEAQEQPAWCELCTNLQCTEQGAPQLRKACDDLCDGTAIEFQCIGGSACTGGGGGSYPNRLRCLRNLP
jgi:hypothetical protein